MKETPILQTPRLLLRPFTMADVPAVYAWCSSLEATRFLFWYPHRDIGVSERLVANWIRKKRNYSWALGKEGQAIGEVQLIKDLPDRGFEIGYILTPLYWRQGLMKEALSAVLHFLFSTGYDYSLEECDARNNGSRALLEALGYHFEGLKDDVLIAKKNEVITAAYYRLNKEEFRTQDHAPSPISLCKDPGQP